MLRRGCIEAAALCLENAIHVHVHVHVVRNSVHTYTCTATPEGRPRRFFVSTLRASTCTRSVKCVAFLRLYGTVQYRMSAHINKNEQTEISSSLNSSRRLSSASAPLRAASGTGWCSLSRVSAFIILVLPAAMTFLVVLPAVLSSALLVPPSLIDGRISFKQVAARACTSVEAAFCDGQRRVSVEIPQKSSATSAARKFEDDNNFLLTLVEALGGGRSPASVGCNVAIADNWRASGEYLTEEGLYGYRFPGLSLRTPQSGPVTLLGNSEIGCSALRDLKQLDDGWPARALQYSPRPAVLFRSDWASGSPRRGAGLPTAPHRYKRPAQPRVPRRLRCLVATAGRLRAAVGLQPAWTV